MRVALTLGLLGALGVFLRATHRSFEVSLLVLLYALTQVAAHLQPYARSCMLHAKGRVRGMSAISVATKVIWAAGVLCAFAVNAPLWGYGAAVFVPEAIEVVGLLTACSGSTSASCSAWTRWRSWRC